MSIVSEIKVPGAGLGLLAFRPFFFSSASLSPSPDSFAVCKLHIYVKTPDSYGALSDSPVLKKWALNLQAVFGAVPEEYKRQSWIESGGWHTTSSLGGEKRGGFPIIWEIFSRAGSSRATSSCHLLLCAGSCTQTEAMASCLKGELHDHASPSRSIVGIAIPELTQTTSNSYRSR